MMYSLKEDETNKSLVGNVMFIWVGVRLCLLFAVAVVSEARGTTGVGQKTGDL